MYEIYCKVVMDLLLVSLVYGMIDPVYNCVWVYVLLLLLRVYVLLLLLRVYVLLLLLRVSVYIS